MDHGVVGNAFIEAKSSGLGPRVVVTQTEFWLATAIYKKEPTMAMEISLRYFYIYLSLYYSVFCLSSIYIIEMIKEK